jgi:type I restriction enzyme S subunit
MAPNGWNRTRLADLGTLRNGVNFNRHQEGKGIPVLKVKDFGTATFVPDSGLDELDTSKIRVSEEQLLQKGDVVIIRSNGNIELVGRSLVFQGSHRPVTFSGFCIRFRPDQTRVYPPFSAYLIRSPLCRERFSAYGSGTGIQNLNQEIIGNMPIDLPPLNEQRRSADILGTLDDKIELNRRMNETLEAIARRLFKSWFIDFDPVHAKAALRREHPKLGNADLSRRALPNMAPEIAELFPDSFEDSTLGRIPNGWSVGKLSDHTEATRGLSYKGSGLSTAGVPLHNLNSVLEGGGYKFHGIKFYTGEFQSRHRVSPGDVIVANTEQGHDCLLIGYAAIVPDAFGSDGLFSHHLYQLRIRKTSPITADFLCRLLNSPRMHEVVSGYGNGTTVNMLQIDGVQHPQFVVPTRALIVAYSDLAAISRAQEAGLLGETRRLVKTRDRLLPKVLSGEVTIQTGRE